MPAIRAATTEADLDAARRLFEEYAQSLPFALDFQGFREEIDALPGEYEPPDGCILLAQAGSSKSDPAQADPAQADPAQADPAQADPAGCVALRPLAPGADDASAERLCEMKRLYVRPAYRGQSLGRALAESILDEARRREYDAMRLDTVASMHAANGLYRALGFRKIGAYRHNPLDQPVFFEKRL